MKILALDYGQKRVGTAVADSALGIAFPRDILVNDESLIKHISQLCKKENIAQVVVGYPLPLSGEPSNQSQIAERFADDLEDELQIPVEFFCERFTTKTAEALLQNIGYSAKEQKGSKDSIAAMLILQGVLDRKKKHQ